MPLKIYNSDVHKSTYKTLPVFRRDKSLIIFIVQNFCVFVKSFTSTEKKKIKNQITRETTVR